MKTDALSVSENPDTAKHSNEGVNAPTLGMPPQKTALRDLPLPTTRASESAGREFFRAFAAAGFDGPETGMSAGQFMLKRHLQDAVERMGVSDQLFLLAVLALFNEEWHYNNEQDGHFVECAAYLMDRFKDRSTEGKANG